MTQHILQQLHDIWLNESYEHIREIEIEFNAVLKANNLPELPEEFYDDINTAKSDKLKYFTSMIEKYTVEIEAPKEDFFEEADRLYKERNDN